MIKKEIIYVVRCNNCEDELYFSTTQAGAEEYEEVKTCRGGKVLCDYCEYAPTDPTPEEVARHDEYLARLREEDAKHIPEAGKKVNPD